VERFSTLEGKILPTQRRDISARLPCYLLNRQSRSSLKSLKEEPVRFHPIRLMLLRDKTSNDRLDVRRLLTQHAIHLKK